MSKSSLWDIVKTVGAGVISNVVPGGSAIVSLINEVLPDDKKLPETATGSDAITAINSLPPEQQVAVMNKQLDVDMTQIKESYSTVRAMLESDAKNPHSTRPRIALGSFYVVATTVGVVIFVWALGVLTDDTDMIKAVMDGWPFILAVIGPLITVLLSYFGVLKAEHKNRLDAANGSSNPSGLVGAISNIFKKN